VTVALSAEGSAAGAPGVLGALQAATKAATKRRETTNNMLFLVLFILNSPLKIVIVFVHPVMLTG
jgi:hypothetical protein